MPFASKSQARGAFSGAFGEKMKAAAPEWAHATPGGIKSLPDRKPAPKPARKSLAALHAARR
jgi:hypothetical protein